MSKTKERIALRLHSRDVRDWLSCSKRKAFEEVEPPEWKAKGGVPVGRKIGERVHDELHSFDSLSDEDEPQHILYDRDTRTEKEMHRQIERIGKSIFEWMQSNGYDIAPRTGSWKTEAVANVGGRTRLTVRSNIDMIMRDSKRNRCIAVNLYTGVGDPLKLWPSAFVAAWVGKDSFEEASHMNIECMGILSVPRNAPDKVFLSLFPISTAIEMGRRLIGSVCSKMEMPVPNPSAVNCKGCEHPRCFFSEAMSDEL